IRFLPMVAISEVKEVLFEEQPPKTPPPPSPPERPAIPAAGQPATDEHFYGIAARFETAADLIRAAQRTLASGFRRVDAHAPFPIPELNETLGLRERSLPWIVTGCGAAALVFGIWVLWYVDVVHYPTPVGGRPLDAWPAYGLPVFEFTVLVS